MTSRRRKLAQQVHCYGEVFQQHVCLARILLSAAEIVSSVLPGAVTRICTVVWRILLEFR